MPRSKYTTLEKLDFIDKLKQANLNQIAFAKYHGLQRPLFKD